ncbi:Tetratricopeptide repeat-containing domain [Macleaya cordata]|uniref:Tetratricopeptide repeat-containing domain n=1 Tax=Macleaya cordata TaxID=56857 RepID=A0A200R6A6_MACCD|nr:Tetratricopeptide repeat-containing domain [Macleaya cordata]
MESVAGINHRQNFLNLANHHHHHRRLSFSKPISTISFESTSSKTIRTSIRASSVSIHQTPQNPNKKPSFETLKPLSSFLKTTCVAIATTSLFFNRFNKPSIAAPISQPTVESNETTPTDADTDEEKERTLEEYLYSHPDDVKALKAVMEVKIKSGKIEEAISIIDRLIEIEPTEKEWPLLKAHLLSYSGDVELAKLGFEEVLSKDPLHVEAYHGLVMAASQSESGELENVLKRIENVMERCKKEKKKEDLRDFKLLVAQVRVIEGKYIDALKVYQELVKEEPRDFRPYLCQGIIYTLLKKQDEAEKQFKKYRRLVPKGHPYARYFEDNMIATKVFSQVVENQKMTKKS